ncbi:MAG: hypothetical protein IJP45_03980 [Paludibacteraceae bacterium]|nr:hypothetical protein [Paludibacteraceae bacterium]
MNEEKHSLRVRGLCFDRHYMPEKRTMLGLLQICEKKEKREDGDYFNKNY